jgi:hypothetical protein
LEILRALSCLPRLPAVMINQGDPTKYRAKGNVCGGIIYSRNGSNIPKHSRHRFREFSLWTISDREVRIAQD